MYRFIKVIEELAVFPEDMLFLVVLCKLIVDVIKLHHAAVKVSIHPAQPVRIDLLKRQSIQCAVRRFLLIQLLHDDTEEIG